MRTSKSRSRSKQSRNRSVGNIVNRVFDSSGPEGKVRGTPQQIIEKYNQLARDAQLGNDRVAAENFQQHSEHYTRMLGEAMRELEAQRGGQGGDNGQNGGQSHGSGQGGAQQGGEGGLQPAGAPQPYVRDRADPRPNPEQRFEQRAGGPRPGSRQGEHGEDRARDDAPAERHMQERRPRTPRVQPVPESVESLPAFVTRPAVRAEDHGQAEDMAGPSADQSGDQSGDQGGEQAGLALDPAPGAGAPNDALAIANPVDEDASGLVETPENVAENVATIRAKPVRARKPRAPRAAASKAAG